MNATLNVVLQAQDWLMLFLHFAALSLLTVGGALAIVPDLHRYLVEQQQWLTGPQLTASIAIGQAAPGPNVLYIGLVGWNVGLNAGGMGTGLFGMFIAMAGILLPSSILVYISARWAHANADLRAVRAFKQGMAPIVIGLLVASGWVMANAANNADNAWPLVAVVVATTLLAWRTRIHLLVLLGAGALLGWFGLV
ncbi:MAG: Chromate transporter [Noviherbaspirillum sp.]|jgi:chromate transporter|nr:Chromate transporter [Noviherbaspirillum sp.]